MPHVLECLDPFKPFETPKRHSVEAGATVRGWLEQTYPGFKEFDKPTICLVNGEPLLRKNWGYIIREGDVVAFVAQPGYFTIPYLIVIVVGLAISLLMPKPKYDSQQGDSVYTIRGQQNRVRLGEPVESSYGRVRLFPSYAAIPYNRFIGNDQFQYSLFCLGQGEWDIESIQIEDTPIGSFKEVQYAVYGPGQPVTLFDDRVVTSSEVGNIELFAPNDSEYEGYVGPFVVNESGTTVTRIEVDLVMPMGLNHITNKGKVRTGNMAVEVQYQQIDNGGAAVGSWTNFPALNWSMATSTAQRFTVGQGVAAGRYQVRTRRTSERDTANNSAQMLQWAALRGFLPSVRNYGNKTMLAVAMRATNNLNDQSAFRINVWGTRKLPIWSAETGWSAPTATRSIVWAICDIARAQYGGQLPATYLPLPDLVALDAIWTAEGRFFDYTFDQKITVWEAMRVAARIGRAVPMIEGSQIQLIRDVPRTLPTMLFNQNNIVENSFKWNISLPKDGDHDSVLVEYTDPNDFLPRQILCLLGDDNTPILSAREGHPEDDIGDNPEEVKLLGCTSADWAYREGLYYRACKKLLRQSASFQTGLEGHLPRFGALVGISHDLPRWAQGGSIVAIDGDSRTLTLSEPVMFGAGNHYIGIRTNNGTSTAALLCTAGADANHIVLAADIPATITLDDQKEPPVFLFGAGSDWAKNCIVTSIAPDGEDIVAIEAAVYHPDVYINDNAMAPEASEGTVSTVPDVPVLDCSSVQVNWAPGSNTEAIATWAPALGATSYELWKSVDEVSWEPLGVISSTFLQFPCTIGLIFIRIRPIGKGIGNWCTSDWGLTEAPDPWEEELPGGDFEDIGGDLFLSAPVGGVEWRWKSFLAAVCGDPPFVPPAAPAPWPRYKRLTEVVSYSGICRPGVEDTPFTVSSSSGHTYIPVGATCPAPVHDDDANAPSGWGWGDFGFCGIPEADTVTKTLALATYTTVAANYYSVGGCCGSQYTFYLNAGGTAIATLSNEDTDQNAIDRAAALTSYTDWQAAATAAAYEQRQGSETQFGVVLEQGRGAWTNAVGHWTYTIRVTTEVCKYSSGEWTEGVTEEFEVTALADGTMQLPEFELTCPVGYQRRPTGVEVLPL